MRNFIVTIEGKKYEVTVEEVSAFAQSSQTVIAAPAIPAAPAPVQAASTPTAAAPAQQPAATAGGTEIESPMPGLILELKSKEGQAVKKGEVILVLEAMKMANDISAPKDGVISYRVQKGANVDTGTLLAVIG